MNLIIALTMFFLGFANFEPVIISKDTASKIFAGCPCQQTCKTCGKKHAPGTPCPPKQ